jgi:GNAT superfamily N-acetyltransferase
MSIELVLPTPDDAEEIAALYATTWLATYPNSEYGITTADIESKNAERLSPERINRLREYITSVVDKSENFYLLAKDNSQIVGVCTATEYDEYVQLSSIYVLPTEQGKGIGGALMKACLQWANPDKPIKLHVVTYNQPAINFYERWGFKNTGKQFTEERFTVASGNALPEIEMIRGNNFAV